MGPRTPKASTSLPSSPADAPSAQAKGHDWRPLTGTGLKWIAIVTMLVDHAGAVLVLPYCLLLYRTHAANAAEAYQVYLLMRHVGRIAFPLFCFALVEGFVHTHSRPRQVVRLALFAAVSEIPFDLALNDGVISYATSLNVMFTLLIAYVVMWVPELVGDRLGLSRLARGVLLVPCAIGGAWLALALDVDYHAFGVLLVCGLYLARDSRVAQLAVGAALAAAYCLVHNDWMEMYSIVGMACFLLYNGRRGRGMKYFFYLFYPLHLLLLWMIAGALA